MTALTGDELKSWVERTSTGWRELIDQHPEILGFPCDIRETQTVAQLLQHIVAVELRYAQRLNGIPETPYEEIPYASSQEIFSAHKGAMDLIDKLSADPDLKWEEELDLVTRSAGTMRASRRTVFVHLFMHSIRHYAQLATLVRQHGIKPGWAMDYLFMGAK